MPSEQADPGAPPAEQQGGITSAQTTQQPPREEPKFTQADLNRILKEVRQKETEPLKSQLQEQRDLYTAQQEQVTGLKALIEKFGEPKGEEEPSPLAPFDEYVHRLTPPSWVRSDADKRTWVDFARREWQTQNTAAHLMGKLAELEETVTAERNARTVAETQRQEALHLRQEAEARQFLATIATDPEINAVSGKALQQWFKDSLVTEPKTGLLAFRNEDGTLVDPREGVIAAMPDFLRKPAITNGGSGAGGPRTPELSPKQKLEAAQTQLDTLRDAYTAHPGPRLQAEVLKARREVLNLQKGETKAA